MTLSLWVEWSKRQQCEWFLIMFIFVISIEEVSPIVMSYMYWPGTEWNLMWLKWVILFWKPCPLSVTLNKTNIPDKQIQKAQTRLNHTGPSPFPHIAEPALQREGEKSHGSTSVQLRCSLLILRFSSTFAAQNEALQMGSEPAFLQEEGGLNLSASP